MITEDEGDVLNILGKEELCKMRDLFKETSEPHVISLIDTKLRWIQEGRKDDLMTFLSPGTTYLEDGTFIMWKQIVAHELFVYTLDPKCEYLYDALMKTRRIDFKKIHLFVFIHSQHHWTVERAIEDMGLRINYSNVCDIYCAPKHIAGSFTIDCPKEVVIRKLDETMAVTINSVWPHRYDGSEKYLAAMIELNGGYGLFLKATGEIVAWVIKNTFGQLGMVQTVEKYRHNSYGSLITKVMCKEIAQEHSVVGTVLIENTASQAMFKKLGFVSIGTCYYLGIG